MKDLGQLVKILGNRARPEIPWISRVSGSTIRQAEVAVNDVVACLVEIEELADSIKRTGRSYYAQFPAPIDLFALVRLTRPRTLVESGVASGVSSAFLLLGMKANSAGVLHSMDFPTFREGNRGNESWAIPQGKASGWAVPSKLRNRWDLRSGRSEELLGPLLEGIGTVDLYCHDSPVDVGHFEFEMKTIRDHLKPGSLVVADNTDRRIFDETARSVGALAYYRRQSSLGAFRVPGTIQGLLINIRAVRSQPQLERTAIGTKDKGGRTESKGPSAPAALAPVELVQGLTFLTAKKGDQLLTGMDAESIQTPGFRTSDC